MTAILEQVIGPARAAPHHALRPVAVTELVGRWTD
jgi:hypothetical protein